MLGHWRLRAAGRRSGVPGSSIPGRSGTPAQDGATVLSSPRPVGRSESRFSPPNGSAGMVSMPHGLDGNWAYVPTESTVGDRSGEDERRRAGLCGRPRQSRRCNALPGFPGSTGRARCRDGDPRSRGSRYWHDSPSTRPVHTDRSVVAVGPVDPAFRRVPGGTREASASAAGSVPTATFESPRSSPPD